MARIKKVKTTAEKIQEVEALIGLFPAEYGFYSRPCRPPPDEA